MKKIVFPFLISFCALNTQAQSYQFGTITADLGAGFGIYGIRSYSPINQENHSGIAIVGSAPAFNADFGIARFLGVGLRYRRGTYGRSGNYKLRGNDMVFRVNFHLANKGEKFDLPIGIGYGLSSFGGNISEKESLKTNGGILNVHVSPHIYFGKYVGMFFSVGYNKHLFNKMEMVDKYEKKWTEADGATWNMGGVYFEFGVAGKFDLLKKKE